MQNYFFTIVLYPKTRNNSVTKSLLSMHSAKNIKSVMFKVKIRESLILENRNNYDF